MNEPAVPQTNTQTRTTDDHRVSSPSATGGSITIQGSLRDWVIGSIMSLSIVTNIVLGVMLSNEWRGKTVADELKRYDFDFFVRNEYSPMKSKVESHETLILALGLKGCKPEK